MSEQDPVGEIRGLLAQGLELYRSGHLAEAEGRYRNALGIDPGCWEALDRLGRIAADAGRFADAAALFRQALDRNPGNAEALYRFGQACTRLGNLAAADQAFWRAIEIAPDFLPAYLGAAETAEAAAARLMALGRLEDENGFKRLAASYRVEYARCIRWRDGAAAEEQYRKAAALHPDNVDILISWGSMLTEHGRPSAGEPLLRRAIAQEPARADAHAALGNALAALGDPGADAAHRQALALRPDQALAAQAQRNARLVGPLYDVATTPPQIYEAHRAWGEEIATAAAAAAATFPNRRDPDRCLRVGYVSPDFKRHSVAQFFEPLLTHHDARIVETFCYANVANPDATTARLKAAASHWRSIVDLSDEDVRRQVRADEIDILIDLAGHSTGNRLLAFAVKPAPVTATWLGYAATTGLPTIDWRITDALADPPGAEGFHTERLMRLPDGFLCYGPRADAPDMAPLPALAARHVTFGSFNTNVKTNSDVIETWAEVLRAVPRSRLVLKSLRFADDRIAARHVELFRLQGIDPERIEMRPWAFLPRDHLASYGDIDIALDPFPYNGTTTTCEALWMGVPAVSLIGDRHSGRVGLSLLSRVGLGHLAAPDRAAYVRLASELASNLLALADLRWGLRSRVAASPLCDAPGFARAFEAALRQMWRDWCERPE